EVSRCERGRVLRNMASSSAAAAAAAATPEAALVPVSSQSLPATVVSPHKRLLCQMLLNRDVPQQTDEQRMKVKSLAAVASIVNVMLDEPQKVPHIEIFASKPLRAMEE
ncbi:unnamed protein product, partial [Prorocentrum cordatum]